MTTTRTSEPPTRLGVVGTVRRTPIAVRYLLGGVCINQLGAFVQTFLVLYLTVHGLSVSRAGLALTAYSAGAVIGSIVGGEAVQRLGSRVTIMGSMMLAAVAVAVIPWLGTPSRFAPLAVVVFVAGLATQGYRPAVAVLLAELVTEDLRVLSFSLMRTALNVGAALSPLIAAGLILLDWNVLFWLDAATSIAYAALAAGLLPNTRPASQRGEAGTPGESVRSAYAYLFRDGRYLLFLLSTVLGATVYVQYTVALPLTIKANGHSTSLYSASLTTFSAIVVLTELKLTTYIRHWRPYVAGGVGMALMALGVAGYGLPLRTAALPIVCTVFFVFGVMVSGPTMFAYPSTFPAPVRARYVAAHQALFGLGLAVGPTLGVFTWVALGRGVGWLFAAVGAGAAITAWLSVRPADGQILEH